MKQLKFVTLVYRFLKSVKLALILIGYLIVVSIIATLIPQGRQLSYYQKEFSPLIGGLIIRFGVSTFFRSFLFLVPLGIFFINLAVCTVDRIVRRFKYKSPLRPGPDLIHIGLLVLMIAGVFSLFERQEGFTFLAPGNMVKLPGGYTLELTSFTYSRYKDGRPREWISKVHISKGNSPPEKAFIEVNHPLRLGKLNLFQYSYRDRSTVTITDSSGNNYALHPGETFKSEKLSYRFLRLATDSSGLTTFVTEKDPPTPAAIFAKFQKDGETLHLRLNHNDTLGPFTLTKLTPRLETGINVVYDPGFVPILISLILLSLGLLLTFIQKRKGETKP